MKFQIYCLCIHPTKGGMLYGCILQHGPLGLNNPITCVKYTRSTVRLGDFTLSNQLFLYALYRCEIHSPCPYNIIREHLHGFSARLFHTWCFFWSFIAFTWIFILLFFLHFSNLLPWTDVMLHQYMLLECCIMTLYHFCIHYVIFHWMKIISL